jgi:hypothetical protein
VKASNAMRAPPRPAPRAPFAEVPSGQSPPTIGRRASCLASILDICLTLFLRWKLPGGLHALHHGTLAKPDKHSDRLSRHLYDLHRLWHTPALRPALLDPVLLDAVARNKTVFFKEGKARYELLAERKLAATPHPALQSRLQADFVAMQSMFFPGSKVPTFDELLATPREIEALVASWERSG